MQWRLAIVCVMTPLDVRTSSQQATHGSRITLLSRPVQITSGFVLFL